MKQLFLMFSAAVVIAASPPRHASAAEITVIGPGGVRAAVNALIPGFEKASGHTVKATFGSGGGTKDRVIKGDAFDVPIVQPPLDPVLASGHVVTATQKLLAEVPIGLAVRAGAAKPDISTADAVKGLLLGAKSIAYPNAAGSPTGGAAGVSFNETLAKLGIAAMLKPKIKSAANGAAAMAMVAHGEVEIGLTFLSEMVTEPGILIAGTLPRDISTPTALVGFLSAHAKDVTAARALIAYLSGPDAAVIYKDNGMVPGQ
jgi:molybdate transport system substrate-binding protein